MSDLFHEEMPFDYLDQIFDVIRQTSRHTYQILTKRAAIMRRYLSGLDIPENIWIGVTVENKEQGLPRIEHLRNLGATVRFPSIEPLLEDLGDIDLENIDWVIVGGESGNKARPMEKDWILNIKQQCERKVSHFSLNSGERGERTE